MVVTILSLGRSGTSLLTKLLQISGVFIGKDDEMIKPNESNIKGYWENLKFYDINQRLLALYHGSWRYLPILPENWVHSNNVIALRTEALNMIISDFSHIKHWGWKDPRTTLTLPFWQDIIPDLKYVICIRNPIDVANSVQHFFQDMSWDYAIKKWHYVTLLALVQTPLNKRKIIFYEDLLKDYRCVLPSLWDLLELPPILEGSLKDKQAQEFIDNSLRHFSHTDHDVANHADISEELKDLYMKLRRGGELPDENSMSENVNLLEDLRNQVLESERKNFIAIIEKEREQSRRLRASLIELESYIQSMH